MSKKLKYMVAFPVTLSQCICASVTAANAVDEAEHKKDANTSQKSNECEDSVSLRVKNSFSNIYKYTTKTLACAGLMCGASVAMHGVKNIVKNNADFEKMTDIEKIAFGLEIIMGLESILGLSEIIFK